MWQFGNWARWVGQATHLSLNYELPRTVGHAPQQLHHTQHKEHVWRELLNGGLLDGRVLVEGVDLQLSKTTQTTQHTPTSMSG
jgi:hypothetical protein